MFGGSKKKAKKLEAEKAAARAAMEAAGIDMGHEAAAAVAEKDAKQKAEEKVAEKMDEVKEAKDAAQAKSSRKTGDMKRKLKDNAMKISRKLNVDDQEAARRACEYEPGRMIVKNMKPEWKDLAEKAEVLGTALDAEDSCMRELFSVLSRNAAEDRTRLLIDAKTDTPATNDAPPVMLFQAPPKEGAGRFRAALWREPGWQILSRCSAGGNDVGDAAKAFAQGFVPVQKAMEAGHKGVGDAELVKRRYWDSITDGDNARYHANAAAKDIAKAEKKREKDVAKAEKMIAKNKAKQATKLLQGDKSVEAMMEQRKLAETADSKQTLTIENERAFTHASAMLRHDYENAMRQALVQVHRGMSATFEAQHQSMVRLGLSDANVGSRIPRPWPLREDGVEIDAGACKQWQFHGNAFSATEMPTLGAVALLGPGHLAVVDAESLQLHYELQLDWLHHIIGLSEEQEQMHTKDWFDPTKAGKKIQEKGTKAVTKGLEAVGVVEEEKEPRTVGCVMEAAGRLWLGCSTGHLCAVDAASARLEAVMEVCVGTGAGISSLGFSEAEGCLTVWAGRSDGDIAVLCFDNLAKIGSVSQRMSMEQPDQLSKSTAVVSLLPSPDGQHMWSVYESAGLILWGAKDRLPAADWVEYDESQVSAYVVARDELWIGYQDSTIHIYCANEGKKITVLMPYEGHAITSMSSDGVTVWVAHRNREMRILDRASRQPINVVGNSQDTPVRLVHVPTRLPQVWSCNDDGTVRVWPVATTATPAPPNGQQKLLLRCDEYTKPGRVKIRAMSWNVDGVKDGRGLGRGTADLGSLLRPADYDVLVVALQGSGIQAPSAASMWQDALSTPLSGFSFVEVARHTGLLLFVAVRDNHEPYVSNVTVQTADTTLLNRSDNGNAVAVHLTLHASEFSFVNSALTPGQGQGAHALSLHEAALLLTTGICAQLP